MPRSGDDARRRLQQAALELYRQHGYDATTAAEIAARAGVTERTFFRHFADKREVLFSGEAVLTADLRRGVAEAPAGRDVLAVLEQAFGVAFPLLEANRADARARQDLIDATPALHERALAKEASLVATVAAALEARGIEARPAHYAAQLGMTAFNQATVDWWADDSIGLSEHLHRAIAELRAVAR